MSAAPRKPTHNEVIKEENPTLSGTILQTLQDDATDRFSNDDGQFIKFHGIYQQDDRDTRKTAKKFMFMVRGRLPAGVVHPKLYQVFDQLSQDYANNTLRITSRQGFQFHGIVKSGLGKLMKSINDALATTLAACGDVNRNVMAPPTPSTSPLVDLVHEDTRRLSNALLPQTRAYHQIWVEGQALNLEEEKDFVDPLYGKTYLPRKFKTGFAIPPLNDIDVLTNCLGFIAIAEGDRLAGYNLAVGGGMGMSHGNEATYPRVADVIGFFTPEHIEKISKAVLTIHRDFGDRTDRKHARLKYVVEEKGVDWFRQELEERTGLKLAPPRPYQFTRQGDMFGWHQQSDGRWFLGLYVQTGRIQDTDSSRLKTALRVIVDQYQTEVRLTASQNLLLVNVDDSNRQAINEILKEHGVAVDDQASNIRLASMACPALPTCGLALAESERALPDLLGSLETVLEELNLPQEEIVIRMTGCPNGCVRPYMAEIGIVGRAPNKYHLFLGGNEASTRLNRIFKENVKTDELIPTLKEVLGSYVQNRQEGERFGDWCERSLWNGA